MIKGLYYLRSLKLSLFGFLISFFILSGSFVNSEWVIRDNGYYGYSTIDNSLDLNVVNKGQLMTQRLGQTERMLAFSSYEGHRIYFFWAINQKPYYVVYYPGRSAEGFSMYYKLCDGIVGSTLNNCNVHTITDNFATEVGGFFDSITINDVWGYEIMVGNCYSSPMLHNQVCFSSSGFNKSICFSAGTPDNSVCAGDDYGGLTGSLGFGPDRDFTAIPAGYLNTPPGFAPVSSGNIVGGDTLAGDNTLTGDMIYSEVSTGFALNYIESVYGFDRNICFVGTDDLDTNYGSGGSFSAGQGKNIFEMYEHYYGDINNSTYGLQSVANFIEAWVINYYNWFMTDGNPNYLARYNSGSDLYDKYYSDLSFPFVNNPFAIYFMANNVWDYVQFYGDSQDLKGDLVVDYCNMLLNGSNISDMISPGTQQSIYENSRRNKDYASNWSNEWNPDGSSWQGVFTGGSGNTITDGTNFINTYFNKVKDNYQLPLKNGVEGSLPVYITITLLALLFFRFLSH